MAVDNSIVTSKELITLDDSSCSSDEHVHLVNEDEDVKTLEGDDLSKIPVVKFLSPEEAVRDAEEARSLERPIDYRYIEQMKKEGVSEELAIKAFVGRFCGNEDQTQFFLNSDFYYGRDAPTPLDRLKKAVAEDTVSECIEMLEGTKISLEFGDHF